VYDPNILAHLKLLRIRRHFEVSLIEAVSAVHVFTEMEENQVKLLAKNSNIIQSPTGYNLPEEIMLWKGGGGYIFFNGRLDINHKGIDLLLTAFKKSSVERDLLLVGPDFQGDLARVLSLVLQLGIEDRVYIISPQSRAVIEHLGIHCDLYVHPSRWEAFGRSTIEMMALGVPTMISSTENIASIDGVEHGCHVVEPSSHEIEKFLSAFFSDEQKINSEKNGREWVKNNLNWKNIIEKYSEDLSKLN
jgi:glycosyltransferase involved in cell wall biosynthesis